MYRDPKDCVIAGVCGGIARWAQVHPTVVRLVFALGFLYFGVGPIAYAILWACTTKR